MSILKDAKCPSCGAGYKLETRRTLCFKCGTRLVLKGEDKGSLRLSRWCVWEAQKKHKLLLDRARTKFILRETKGYPKSYTWLKPERDDDT